MIRRAEKKDIDVLVELSIKFHEYFDEIYGKELNPQITSRKDVEETLVTGFSDEKHDLFVVELDGKVIGFGDLWTYPEFVHSGNSAYIQNMFVLEEYRGQGWGKKMIQKLIENAKKRDAVAIHVTTSKRNVNAIALYKKMGISDEGILLESSIRKESGV